MMERRKIYIHSYEIISLKRLEKALANNADLFICDMNSHTTMYILPDGKQANIYKGMDTLICFFVIHHNKINFLFPNSLEINDLIYWNAETLSFTEPVNTIGCIQHEYAKIVYNAVLNFLINEENDYVSKF